MSAVREAIEAALEAHKRKRFFTTAGEDELIDRLVAAVEAVPVKVTIRELDMADSENIVSVRDVTDVEYLLAYVTQAQREGVLHLTVDGGYLKVKAGDYGSWCAPVQTEVYNP